MTLSSFDRVFMVSDPEAASRLQQVLDEGSPVLIRRRNLEAESKRGARRLAKRLAATPLTSEPAESPDPAP